MATEIGLTVTPASLLRMMRGEIVDARIAYPEILHLDIRDSGGDIWLFATQYADWSPSDPGELIGRSVEDIRLDEGSGALSCPLSDGSSFEVTPGPDAAGDDPPYWELITPTDLALEFGPGVRWQIGSADAPPSS